VRTRWATAALTGIAEVFPALLAAHLRVERLPFESMP
jgi:hypothetical protein